MTVVAVPRDENAALGARRSSSCFRGRAFLAASAAASALLRRGPTTLRLPPGLVAAAAGTALAATATVAGAFGAASPRTFHDHADRETVPCVCRSCAVVARWRNLHHSVIPAGPHVDDADRQPSGGGAPRRPRDARHDAPSMPRRGRRRRRCGRSDAACSVRASRSDTGAASRRERPRSVRVDAGR